MPSLFRFLAPLALLGGPTAALAADDIETQQAAFPQCIAQLQDTAREQGISAHAIDNVLGQSVFQAKVIGYDRNQPEFVQTFPNYLSKRVTQWRIDKGREMLAKHKDVLQKLNQQYGIPAHYLIAFWGLETNFGGYKGKMPIVDSLATLACDARRSAFFTEELMQALRLVDREALNREMMVGSWAGAMGHTQFMPSAYLKYAKDGDGDGKTDLWNSEVDALTSAANFLSNLGWQRGFRWGREVKVNDGFDYALAGKDQAYSLTFWQEQGVTKADTSALGAADLEGSVLVPAGHQGPAFLVYPNFDVIMRWNNSESYAIAVGYLADRIVGAGPLSKPLPKLPDFAVGTMKEVQVALNSLGFDVGKADGILGPATRKGVRGFQKTLNMIADGYPGPGVISALQEAVAEQQIQ